MISQLITLIKKRQLEIAFSLANGNAKSFDAYQLLVGEHRGLQTAMDSIEELLRAEEDRDNN